MKRKFTATLCLLFFSALTACGGQDIPAETAPTIRPAVFSQDAQDLLDVLGGDDTLAFFDYTVEEPIHSVSTEVWKYVDGSWKRYGNFPFCTIEPNVGVITVPDDRLNKLAGLVDPDRIVPTTVEIVDIAGLVKGASKGEGLGNKFLANIRETDAILHVLRCFDDENVTHVDGSVDPVRDKEIIDTELQLKDLETIESRIQKVQKQAQTGGDKVARQTYEVLVRYREALLQGKSARTVQFETKDEQKIAHELFLLTSKPVMYVCNVDEASAVSGNKYVEQVREAVKEEGAEILIVAAKTEADIAELETYEDRQMFLQEVGLEESGVSRLIRAAYKLLNLETYFTAGKMEVRAWTFHKGWKAPQCAGVIHTDFEKGFIRAEVIKYDEYSEIDW